LQADWIAPNATVIGDVRLGAGSSFWHGVVARGDTAEISVGRNSVIQDLVHLGSTSDREAGDKVSIGDSVHVGANAVLDACTLESFAYVGMGAHVGKGAVVESFAVVAAGAHVPAGATVPSGQVWAGAPARYLRDLTQEEKHLISEHHLEMQQLSQIYCEETEKSFRELIDSRDRLLQYKFADPVEKAEDEAAAAGVPVTHEDMDYIEHRVYHDYVGTVDYDIRDPAHSEGSFDKNYIPYEQDMTHYPEVFRQYQENYSRFDKLKTRFETETPFVEQGESPFTRRTPKDMSPWEKRYDDAMPKYTGTLCQ
jgi:carbonic anhydrase/acetyltransferase-like protein (isoleucine patch superfamily)